jgi:hypothetical protein
MGGFSVGYEDAEGWETCQGYGWVWERVSGVGSR